MNIKLLFMMVCFSILMSACQATSKVMNKTIPDKYVEVIQESPTVDIESSLKASGKEYICKELYFGKGSSNNRRACYIKAPEESKFKKFGIKLLDAPEAILEDTGNDILVVGKVLLTVLLHGAYR